MKQLNKRNGVKHMTKILTTCKLARFSCAFHKVYIRMLHVQISLVTEHLDTATSGKLRRKTVDLITVKRNEKIRLMHNKVHQYFISFHLGWDGDYLVEY